MRVAVLASIAVVLALAGCMQMSGDDEDWEPYDSGRGLGFSMVLTILLIIGGVVLVANLSGRDRTQPPPPATPPPSEAPAGWEVVEPIAPPADTTSGRKPAPSKPAKPRRRSP